MVAGSPGDEAGARHLPVPRRGMHPEVFGKVEDAEGRSPVEDGGRGGGTGGAVGRVRPAGGKNVAGGVDG
jgi:hypothetical protein